VRIWSCYEGPEPTQGVQASRAAQPGRVSPSSAPEAYFITRSERAQLALEVKAALEKLPEVRLEKVSLLRAAVKAGAWKPDSNLVAQRLLSDPLGLSRGGVDQGA
jgi:anti-sigma28 factor (negative regulator of flagellin synthesis)